MMSWTWNVGGRRFGYAHRTRRSATVAAVLTQWINDNPSKPLRFVVKKVNDGAPGHIDFHSKDAVVPGWPTLGFVAPIVVVAGDAVAPSAACTGVFPATP